MIVAVLYAMHVNDVLGVDAFSVAVDLRLASTKDPGSSPKDGIILSGVLMVCPA